jgi:hypothetical protein
MTRVALADKKVGQAITPAPGTDRAFRELEVELGHKLDHAPADREVRIAGSELVLVGLYQQSIGAGEVQLNVGIAARIELRQRMIQEVESRETQFDPLVLRDREPLINRQVAVEVVRPFDVRPDDIALRAGHSGRKAARIEVLARTEPAPRIASDSWNDVDRARAELLLPAIARAGTSPVGKRMIDTAETGVQSPICIPLNRRAALQLGNPREHPSVDYTARKSVVLHGAGQVDHVGRIKDLAVVPVQNAVI